MTAPIYAIAYVRVSDTSQVKGGGLADQEKNIIEYIKKNGWQIYNNKTYKEVYTGTTSSRPVYQSLLTEIAKNKGKVSYFVVKVIDRISRSGSNGYFHMKEELSDLGVQLRDSQGVIQPTINTLESAGVSFKWSNRSPSALNEAFLSETAKQEHSNTLTRTVASSIERVETGYKVRGANDGYINRKCIDSQGRLKYIQVPDPERAHLIRMIFELSAEGLHSDEEIIEKINNLGYRTKFRQRWNKEHNRVIGTAGGLKMSVKLMQQYRKKPIYCGINSESWGTIESRRITVRTQYDGLVSIDTFNRANKGKVYVEDLNNQVKIYYDYKKKDEPLIKRRQKFRKDFVFKNIILCPECKKPFLASSPKNKLGNPYPEYHCARNHKRVAVSKLKFESQIKDYFREISLKGENIEVLKRVCISKFTEERKNNNKNLTSIDEQLLSVQERQDNVLETLMTSKSGMIKSKLEKEYEDLENRKEEIRAVENQLKISEGELSDFLNIAEILMEHPTEMLTDVDNTEEQVGLSKMFFDELPTYSEILNGTPKLSLVFRLKKINQEINGEISQLVTLQRIEL